MSGIIFSPKELAVLRKAIESCVAKCQQGGIEQGCEDCKTLEAILSKLKSHE